MWQQRLTDRTRVTSKTDWSDAAAHRGLRKTASKPPGARREAQSGFSPEPSEGTNTADAFISDPASNTGRQYIHLYCFKLPILWLSLKAALGKEYPPRSHQQCIVTVRQASWQVIYTVISRIFHHSPKRKDALKLRKRKAGEFWSQITSGRSLVNNERGTFRWETCKSIFGSNNLFRPGIRSALLSTQRKEV